MDIQNNLKGSIQKLASALRQGKNLVIFPEGTRSVDGTLGSFKKTYAILAKALEAPVVPVCIDGSMRALPRYASFLRLFTKFSVDYLDPVYPKDLSVETLNDRVREQIFDKLQH